MEDLSLVMLRDKSKFLKCHDCKNCSGMKCSTSFIASMADITIRAKEEKSVYIIGNGLTFLENLEYREYPKSLLSNLIALFLKECSSFTEINSSYLGLLACLKPIVGDISTLKIIVPLDVVNIINDIDSDLARDIQIKYRKYNLDKPKLVAM